MYKVIKNIKLVDKNGSKRRSKYPFSELKVNDGFEVPVSKKTSVYAASFKFRQDINRSAKFIFANDGTKFQVKRIA